MKKTCKPDSEILELTHELWHLVEDLRKVHLKIDEQDKILKEIDRKLECLLSRPTCL